MILEIFGWLGSVLLLYSLTQAHPRRFRYLNLAACLALLGSVPLGRLVHTAHELATVVPVNFVLLPDGVYLRTAEGSAALAARLGALCTTVFAFN